MRYVPAKMLPWAVGLTLVFGSIAPEALNLFQAEIYDLGKHVVKEC